MTPRLSGLLTGGLTVAWVLAVGILAGGAAGGALVSLALGLALLMLLTFLGPLKGVEVERILPSAPVRTGDTVTVALHVRSRRWWPWLLLRVSDTGHEVQLSLLRREATVTYRIPAVARGIHRFGEIRLTAADPLGMAQFTRLLMLPGELVVWPAPVSEVRALLPAGLRAWAAAGDATAAAGETTGVRPYSPGDPPQRIHWPASARTAQLLTRLSEPAPSGSLHLVVNAPAEQLEQALSQAAGLVEWSIRNHLRVGLTAGTESAPPARGSAQLGRLMRVLSACRAADSPVAPGAPGSRTIRLTGERLTGEVSP